MHEHKEKGAWTCPHQGRSKVLESEGRSTMYMLTI